MSMNREEHNRIVAAGIKALGIKQHQESDFDRLMYLSRQRIEKVRFYANSTVQEHRLALRTVDPVFLAKELQEQFLNEFRDYKHDELLAVFVIFLSQLTMKEVM